MSCEPLWTARPTVLLEHPLNFLPARGQCFETQVNAFARFGIYLAVLIAALRRAPAFLVLVPVILALSAIVARGAAPGATDGFSGSAPVTQPTQENPFMNLLLTELTNCGKERSDDPWTPSEGVEGCGATTNVLPSDEPASASRGPCYKPEAETGPVVRRELDRFFTDQMWSDPADVFNHSQSQREYVTQPNTTNPSAQDAFIAFAYNGMSHPTCKEGGAGAAFCGLDRGAQGLVQA